MRTTTLVSLAWLALMAFAPAPRAHEGPPFPVIVDEVHEPWSVSVWADPDVGIGTFWVQLEPAEGHQLPTDTRAEVWVSPSDGRIAEVVSVGEPESTRYGEQHVAEVDFPTREFWTVRVVLTSASAGASAETVFSVEVTPPGYGPLDLLLYTWPFVAIGLLWMKALLKHRKVARDAAARSPTQDVTTP